MILNAPNSTLLTKVTFDHVDSLLWDALISKDPISRAGPINLSLGYSLGLFIFLFLFLFFFSLAQVEKGVNFSSGTKFFSIINKHLPEFEASSKRY